MPVDRSHPTPTRARSGPDSCPNESRIETLVRRPGLCRAARRPRNSYGHFACFRSSLCPRSPATHVGQPVGTGSAQIRWSIAPNSRRVRWLSARRSQWYRACFHQPPTGLTRRCWRLVSDQLSIRVERTSRRLIVEALVPDERRATGPTGDRTCPRRRWSCDREVKGEGEEPIPISRSYTYINSPCIIHLPRTRV